MKKKIPSILSLLAFLFSILQLHRRVETQWRKKKVIKDKEILIKRKCHQARCDSRWCVMSKAFEHLIETSRSEVFLFHSRRFHFIRNPFLLSPLLCYVICFHSFFQNSTTCFDLCIGDACSHRTLEQLLWYIVALIMKWDAALDAILILKNIFFENII